MWIRELFEEADGMSGFRIGNRIRRIRTEKGLSQAELGEKVGLNAGRIQQYENGERKPKKELLGKIACALGVSPLALEDPDTTNYLGAIYAFFEVEEIFGLKIEEAPKDRAPGLCLSVDFTESLYPYLQEWYVTYSVTQEKLWAAESQEEKDVILKEYHNWKWNFPQGIADRTAKELHKLRLKKKIEQLQAAYDSLSLNQD